MKTTEIVVELVVIGYGAVLALALFYFDELKVLGALTSVSWPLVLIVTSLGAYISGIMVDRLADALFSPVEDLFRKRIFGTVQEFQKIRLRLYDSSNRLNEWAQYNRIRSRVCRGWVLDSLFLIVALYYQRDNLFHSVEACNKVIYLLVFFGLALLVCWLRLLSQDLNRLQQETPSTVKETASNKVKSSGT